MKVFINAAYMYKKKLNIARKKYVDYIGSRFCKDGLDPKF